MSEDRRKMRGLLRLFHRTDAADEILRDGSRDSDLNPARDGAWKGVWFSDRPLTESEGMVGNDVLVFLVREADVARFEWRDEGKPYREFVVPQEIVSRWRRPRREPAPGVEVR